MADKILTLILLFPCLLIGCTVHECAHALAAKWCGDPTAERMGRLTLNPIKHIDPIGTLLLPVVSVFLSGLPLLMWAKPVPVNPMNYRKPSDDILVSLAGPASNVLLFILITIILKMSTLILPETAFTGGVMHFTFILLLMNIVMAVFNLIPLPPLDGSSVVHYFFIRGNYVRELQWANVSRFSFLILLIIIQFPFVQKILVAMYQVPLRLAFTWIGIN